MSKQWVKSASGHGIQEVSYLMEAFEAMNGVKLELSFTMERAGTRFDLVGKVTAWETENDGTAAKLLGSQSVICSAINLQTVEAVCIHLLYMLDGFLARKEMRGDAEK